MQAFVPMEKDMPETPQTVKKNPSNVIFKVLVKVNSIPSLLENRRVGELPN